MSTEHEAKVERTTCAIDECTGIQNGRTAKHMTAEGATADKGNGGHAVEMIDPE